MLTHRIMLIVCLAILLTDGTGRSLIGAQTSPATVDSQEEAEHEKLREFKRLYEEAVRNDRVDTLEPYLHKDFSGVMITNEGVTSFAEMKEYWQRIRALMGKGGRYTTTLYPERSVIMGEIALARGTMDDVVVTDAGREYRFTSRWTALLQKQEGAWKIRHVHASMDPIGNPFVKEFGRRAVMWSATISGIVGVALGFGLAVLLRRRRGARPAST